MSDVNIKISTKPVIKYFEEISKIPRCSSNEKEISDFLVAFARSKNLEVLQDKALNVLIKKPATTGYEKGPIVILQGHMDMVCDKNKSKKHDFKKDPIVLRVVGDMIFAKDTTLGADNGIAVAYALALLDSNDIPHPPLRVLITTEEEVGLKGALALDSKYLEGDMLINMDGIAEGLIILGCAGGVRTRHFIPVIWQNSTKDFIPYQISVRGLKGGHSGAEIDKGRGNSNKLMGRFLNSLLREIDFCLSKINGGSKMNAIPRETESIVLINPHDEYKLVTKVDEWNLIFKKEFKISDPGVSLKVRRMKDVYLKVLSRDIMGKVISLLVLMPNGVQTMSKIMEGLVESSINFGVVSTNDSGILFESSIRSNVKSLKQNILSQVQMIANILQIDFKSDSEYPEWEYNSNSKLKEIFKKVYKKIFHSELKIRATHGGLECGILKEKNKHLDMVAFGPNMYDVHSPSEHISIISIERTWEYLLAVLKEINFAK